MKKHSLFNLSLLALSFSCLTASSVFAMGSSPSSPSSGTTTDPGAGIVTIGNTIIQLNPYIQILQSQFKAATKPITTSTDNTIIVATGNGIALNKRYDCRIYPIFTMSTTSGSGSITGGTTLVPGPTATPSQSSWYEFQLFGGIFLDNQAFMEGAKIKTFASEPQFANEVWGESQDGTYYEAIRLNGNRDLLVEGFSPAATWVQVALQLLGVSANSSIEQDLQNLAITTSVSGIEGFVVSYSYCPNAG